MLTNEDVKAKNLARARRQVKHWRAESDRNRQEMVDLKAKMDEAFDRGKEIAGNLAEAMEYLQDLENEPNV